VGKQKPAILREAGMNILSIDPGSNQIGAFVSANGQTGSYSFRPHGSLMYVQKFIQNRITENGIKFALIEDYAYGDVMAGKRTMSEVVGVIKYTFELFEVQWIAVPIGTWQSYMTKNLPQKWTRKKSKKGKEYKARTKESEQAYLDAVNREYRTEFKTPDAADAWMIYAAMEMISRGIVKTPAAAGLKAEMDKLGFFKKEG
jgi:hypothetical protein